MHSLVDSGIVLPLRGETEHATNDSAAKLAPVGVTYLFPFSAILDLHVTLGYRDALTI